jgi:hypothetical protein
MELEQPLKDAIGELALHWPDARWGYPLNEQFFVPNHYS